jgi:hypothetical protein
MCDFLVEIAISETYFKFLPLDSSLYPKVPWYPKLLFQRENALASF